MISSHTIAIIAVVLIIIDLAVNVYNYLSSRSDLAEFSDIYHELRQYVLENRGELKSAKHDIASRLIEYNTKLKDIETRLEDIEASYIKRQRRRKKREVVEVGCGDEDKAQQV